MKKLIYAIVFLGQTVVANAQQPGPGYQYPLGTQPNQYQTQPLPMQGGPMDWNNAPMGAQAPMNGGMRQGCYPDGYGGCQ